MNIIINSREQIILQKSHEPRNINSYLLISVNIQVGCLTNDVIHNFITSLFRLTTCSVY